jgi:hypothetical protein
MKRKRQAVKPEDSRSFSGMEGADRERMEALAAAQAEELTAELRRPLADISAAAGQMERDAPLFFGTGDNPGLF